MLVPVFNMYEIVKYTRRSLLLWLLLMLLMLLFNCRQPCLLMRLFVSLFVRSYGRVFVHLLLFLENIQSHHVRKYNHNLEQIQAKSSIPMMVKKSVKIV